ncbi:MAG: pyridoxal phosphate-dependent aminotransferase [Sulfolobales archaeon]
MVAGISHRVYSIMPSPTMWIQDLVSMLKRSGRDYYSLHVGQPGIPPPREVIDRLSRILAERCGDISLYTYTSPRGIPELREAVAEDLASLGRVKPNPLGGVVITTGGIEGLFASIASVTDPGDPVGIVTPAYFHFYSILGLLGNRVVEISSYPDLFVTHDSWADLFSKVRAVIVANPDNPTGRTLDRDEARLLADLACDKRVYLIHDVAYSTLYYEASREWPENYCEEYVITVGTFSKDPGIPGWRLGFIASNEDLANAIAHAREATSYNAPVPSQILVLEYLRGRYREKFLPKVIEEYRSRRDIISKALEELLPNARFRKPGAGIFIYADLSKYLETGSDEWVRKIAIDSGVIAVPGMLFGSGGEKWVRFSFAWEPGERLWRAIEIIASKLKNP